MDHFNYIDGTLNAENVDLCTIAHEIGTPFYCYSKRTIERHYRVFNDALGDLQSTICFAVKANSNQAVLSTLAAVGAGADVVSGGELTRALSAGIPASKIVFSGVAKTAKEMEAALKAGIKQFNVESEPELEVLATVAAKLNMIAPVALRINPDVDAGTHEKISTGKAENKFGIPWTRARQAYGAMIHMPSIEAIGVDVHIGSQLTELAPFKEAFTRVVNIVKSLKEDGHNIRHIDLGGGLGIPYEPGVSAPPLPSEYGKMVQDIAADIAADLDCEYIFEPGRLIAGNAGILVTEITYVKEGEEGLFYILDAAMNDLTRPAMYGAYHDIIPVKETTTNETVVADFVGPVCETGDTFAKKRLSVPARSGDLFAIKSAGAYGAVMASSYNSRPLIPEVMVNDNQFAVIRKRQTIEEMLALDIVPDWT